MHARSKGRLECTKNTVISQTRPMPQKIGKIQKTLGMEYKNLNKHTCTLQVRIKSTLTNLPSFFLFFSSPKAPATKLTLLIRKESQKKKKEKSLEIDIGKTEVFLIHGLIVSQTHESEKNNNPESSLF